MKPSDYKSLKQAAQYHNFRFAKGTLLVSQDEASLLNNWILTYSQKKGLIFLDLGTGTGRVVVELIKYQPKKIYALDRSDAMLKFLEKTFPNEIKNKLIQLLNATSDKIPLEDNSVDFITSFHLFKHLPDIKPTLEEAGRVLKPNGFLVFEVLNENSLIKFNLGTCVAISYTNLKQKMELAGFKIVETHNLHPLGETVYNLFGGVVAGQIHLLDGLISITLPFVGTKIFVIAQKR